MKRSLGTYEDYYQKLKLKHDTRVDNIKKQYTDKMMQHQAVVASKKHNSMKEDPMIIQFKAECEAQVQELNDGFKKSIDLLLESYDDYMKKFAPAPQFLPVILNLTVPSKNIKMQNMLVSNTETATDLKAKLKERMEKTGDPIINFDKSNLFALISSSVGNNPKKVIIQDEDVPIVQYGPEPGSTIELQGNLRLKSDAPKECFKTTYDKNSSVTMDYYTCKDCKLNWVCKSCAEVCHKGHTVVDYIIQHKPSWACCYCAKSPNKCKLFKKE